MHEHLQCNLLTETDYRRILAAIDFLLPTRTGDRNEYRIMVNAHAKASAMLAGVVS